jgi:hypothetical protein
MKLLNLMLVIALAAAAVHGEGKSKKSGKDKSKAAEEEKGVSGLESIGNLIQEGVRSTDVRNPGFDDGRRTSFVEADSMIRLPGNKLYGEGVTIRLYQEDPKDNVRVDLKTATYHMDTKILSSEDRSKVSRADFEMAGDKMTFDTINSHGTLSGHVHVIIYDLTRASHTKSQEKPLPKAVPVAPPTPAVPSTTSTSAK